MTNVKTLSAVIILATAIATPAFAKEHGRTYDRYRGAYNQMSEPSLPTTRAGRDIESFGFSGGNGGSWLHPSDLRPSGS
jgi:hypothetical protein